MRRLINFVIVSALAGEAFVLGQGGDVNKVLASMREALGGDQKLAAVTSLTVSGRTTRVVNDTSSPPTDVEIAMMLPDKYVRKDVVAVLGTNTLSRTTGFNGKQLIEVMDLPPGLNSGNTFVRSAGSTGFGMAQTPEQQEVARQNTLRANREDFARLTLGLFGASFDGFPLKFASVGVAEAADGKADVIEITGDGDFAARLYVDQKTHLPLMLSWMAREPLRMTSSGGTGTNAGDGRVTAGGGGTVVQGFQSGNAQDREQLLRDLDARMKAADAQRRMVEYRVYYSGYKDVGGGVKMPARIQRAIDGKPSDELLLDKVKLNPKIDPRTFNASK